MMIVAELRRILPSRYFAEPRVHSGSSAEIDVATFEAAGEGTQEAREDGNGDVATAVWAPPRPTLAVVTDLPVQDVYEIRPRKERDGFDLIGDRLQDGPIWYAGPDAVRRAIAYAKYCSRSRWAIIRVFNESGNVTETHEQACDFKEW